MNKDQLRAMPDNGKYSPKNENFRIEIRDIIISKALADDLHIIVDDTNLDPKHLERLQFLALENGAVFEEISFRHVSLDQCISRDKIRHEPVGEEVIRSMHRRYY